MTAAVRLRSPGLTKPDKEDEEADELGEEEDEELEEYGLQVCGERGGNAGRPGLKRLKRRSLKFLEFVEILKQNTRQNNPDIFNFHQIKDFFYFFGLLSGNIALKITKKGTFN